MARLARPSGVFALVALDQRESLRAYLQTACGGSVDDAGVVAFKQAALTELMPGASGVLLDLDFGLPALAGVGALQKPSGLIVAADEVRQAPNGAIVGTELDARVDGELVRSVGGQALKLLVVWRPLPSTAPSRRDLVGRFMARCRDLGVLGLVEALMDEPTRQQARSPGGGDLYVEMADEMAGYGPDIYKTEVPGDPSLPPDVLARQAQVITGRVGCPWVLLSNGVPLERFPSVADAVCQGGASGFLAGRAIWRLAISPHGYQSGGGARDRLDQLVAVVERAARPWWAAGTT
jgi:sulfofructosephosphate aldolase